MLDGLQFGGCADRRFTGSIGRELGTAKYSGSFGAEYNQPIGSMIWFTQLDVNFFDDYIFTGDLDEIDFQEGTELINIRTGLRGENWMLMLYGRNVTDESVANGGADVPLARGSHMRYLNQRRSVRYSGGLGVLIPCSVIDKKGRLRRPFFLLRVFTLSKTRGL